MKGNQQVLPKIYAIGGSIIGFFQVVDGILLLVQGGNLQLFNFIFAPIEFLWAPASIIAITIFLHSKKRLLIPISYIAYNVLVWIAATIFIEVPKQTSMQAAHTLPFTIPTPFIVAGILFGIYYLIACVFLFRKQTKISIQP
jgi:hypothetical protein